MPQMMPLNWLILFLFFNLIFFLINNMIYFNFLIENSKTLLKKKSIKFNWKW